MTGLAAHVLPLLAAASLGLLAGALLAEDRLLVPYWRTLPAETFYALHPTYGPLLYRFFTPLTMAAPPTAALAAIQVALQSGSLSPRGLAAIGAAGLACGLVGIYLAFFKAANESFVRHAVPAAELPAALARWATWHRARVIVCLIAFGLSLVTLVT